MGKMEITHVVAVKNMWGNRRTGSESKTGKQHLTTETSLNEGSDSEQASAAEVPV